MAAQLLAAYSMHNLPESGNTGGSPVWHQVAAESSEDTGL
jgi:hypothetical protein